MSDGAVASVASVAASASATSRRFSSAFGEGDPSASSLERAVHKMPHHSPTETGLGAEVVSGGTVVWVVSTTGSALFSLPLSPPQPVLVIAASATANAAPSWRPLGLVTPTS
jgi:hypothetical protein